MRARHAGMQVVYEGIRLTPEEIVNAARKEKPCVIGLSVLSSSHLPLVQDLFVHNLLAGMTMPLVSAAHHSAGGCREALEKSRRRRRLHGQKDFELNRTASDAVRIVERANGATNTFQRGDL